MRPSPYQSNNPLRVLKAVVDMMKERYTNEDYEPLNLDQLLARIDRTDLSSELQQGLVQALKNNEKVEYYPEGECFLFKPALGLHVRTRKQLLQRLKVNDEEGLGGLLMSEIREAVHSPDRVMKVSHPHKLLWEDAFTWQMCTCTINCRYFVPPTQKLDTAGEVLRIVRQDKEEVIFYNNHDVELETPISEEFKAHWHRVSIDGMTDEDIEKYLQNVGLGAMGGEGRKRKAPGEKKAKKRSRTTKILNVHLDESVLKDYSGDKDS